jgi:hypothetical protein
MNGANVSMPFQAEFSKSENCDGEPGGVRSRRKWRRCCGAILSQMKGVRVRKRKEEKKEKGRKRKKKRIPHPAKCAGIRDDNWVTRVGEWWLV